ncbi:serine/threonine-protein phosphatase 4 regulatory subunit 1-like isoform X4 [Tachypleus tridentatus]|uniref:serine/threonine-protein phosphatase 4 regulatory subunit 1-like isoform X4 n=1 Tax=Tachypleus tridentatus TaxID=6853 RepID=UPI003FD27E24
MLFEDNDELDLERQLVARSILETLRVVADNEEEVDRVVVVLRKLSEDSEPSIRAELMEQIPHIGTFCYEWGGYLADIIPSVIVPTVVKYLTDINNQVRKTTQAALMVMVEQKLIEKAKLEEHICPLVLQLTETEHMDDHRTEAVALMSRMAPLVGKEMTERLFLERFGNLCLDASFHIRKVCASNFGSFSGVVGQKITEDILLYKFQYLCEDGVWGVRKACAEVFMPISCVCSMETRRKELAPLFVSLLCDQSRWVRMAAYQALGPFISTFADPSKTGLYYSEDGVITVKEEDNTIKETSTEREGTPISTKSEYVDCDDRINQNTPQSSLETSHIKSNKSDANPNVYKESFNVGSSTVIESHNAVESVEMEITSEDSSGCGDNNNNVFQVYLGQESGVEISLEEKLAEQFFQHRPPTDVSSQSSGSRRVSESESFSEAGSSKYFITEGSRSRQESVSESPLTVTSKDGHLHVRIDSESAFNTFQFWRIPIPDIELDIELAGNTTNVHVRSRVHDTDHQQICSSDLSVLLTSVQKNDSCQKAEMNALSENLARTKLNQNLSSSSPSSMQTQDTSNSTAHVQTTYISSLTDLQKSTTHVLSSSLNEASILLTPGESSEFRKTRMNLCSPDMEMLLQPLHTVHGTSLSIEEHIISPSDQDIVPPELLEHYVSMTDPTRAQTIDAEITRQCAYSLPAVALTLGRKYWPCLKATYRALASDMQWKVRRTLASSLHELAVILGPNLATRDLLPVFASFLRDLDEVRIGVLQHLSNFLKLLKPLERREFLPRLSEFLKMDNDKNWRFRLTLSEQLTGVTDLYSPIDIKEYLVPMAMILVRDKVALVRQTSLQVLAVMMRHLTTSPDPLFTKSVLAELAEKFTHASKWSLRQTFAFLCHHFVLENSVPIEQFACDILPHLLKLSWDGVPNVRMAVAKCLSQTVWPLDYFSSSQNPHHELLLQALRRLQVDNDRDVRNFAHLALQENSYSFNLMVPPV